MVPYLMIFYSKKLFPSTALPMPFGDYILQSGACVIRRFLLKRIQKKVMSSFISQPSDLKCPHGS